MKENNFQKKELVTDIQDRLNGNNIIAIASGKGGVGKTTLGVTLAQAFSQKGMKVLLFDGDLGLANIDTHLNMTPTETLDNVIQMNDPLHLAVTHEPTINCDVISGHSGKQSLAGLNGAQLKLLTDDLLILATYYDKVIIDLGSGIYENILQLAQCAKNCLVLITNTPTALTNAYQFIQLLSHENPAKEIGIVVNIADTVQEGEQTYQTFLTALKTFLHIEPKLKGIIHYDSMVKKSLQEQTPLLCFSPSSQAAQDILKIEENLSSKN